MKRFVLLFTIPVFMFMGCRHLPAFHQDIRPNSPKKLHAVAKRMRLPSRKPQNALSKPLVIAEALNPRKAILMDPASGQKLWEASTPDAASRFVIAGNKVVYFDRTAGIVALSLKDGHKLWSHPVKKGETFLGIDADNASVAYVTFRRPGGSVMAQVSTITVLDGAGKEKWHITTKGRMGSPVILGGVIAVPFRSHYLVFMDAGSPKELGRLQVPNGEITYVIPSPEGLFFGDRDGFYKFTPDFGDSSKRVITFKPQLQQVKTVYGWDRYDPIHADYSAYDVRRILFTTAHPDVFVYNLFRYAFGFDAKGNLKWAVRIPADNVKASWAGRDLIYFLGSQGELFAYRYDGTMVYSTPSLGTMVRGATFDLAGFTPSSQNEVAPRPLPDILTEISNDKDLRFQMAKQFAIAAMSVVGKAGVGRLLALIVSPDTSKELREKAIKDLLASPDPSAIDQYISLINIPYDYVEGTRPKAVEVMVQVLGKLKDPKAVPALVKLLRSPQTTHKQLVYVVDALMSIGDKRMIRPFREFLLAYRADREFSKDVYPLQRMAEGLFKYGGPRERQVLIFVLEDERTVPRLKEYVKRLLGDHK